MERQELLEKSRKIVAEHLGVDASRVTEDAAIVDDLGGDSLDVIELVMAFEDEFGAEIPDDAAEKLHTFGDCVDYLAAKLA